MLINGLKQERGLFTNVLEYPDKDENTALHLAAARGHRNMVLVRDYGTLHSCAADYVLVLAGRGRVV